jgi:drug/metabolite transporter (DMT)-like permease
VVGLAIRDLCSRAMPAGIATSQLTSWGVGAVGLLGLGMVPFQGWVTPSPDQALILVGAMAFGTGGYWAITAGTRLGEASVVAPFRYSRLIFVMVISLTVFAEYPDTLTLWGAALIIGSGLYAFARERMRARRA